MRDMETPGGWAGRSEAVIVGTVNTLEDNAKPAARKGARLVFETAAGPCAEVVSGRTLWALRALMAAGQAGVTALERPALRWAAYVHKLRRLGLTIETIREEHGGDFAGWHARYVLRSAVALEGGPHV